MEVSYMLAFTTGLLGGFGHCIGMCGPIVASYSLYGEALPGIISKLVPHLLYNTGRVTTYMFIGALAGLAGSFFNVAGKMSGFQNAMPIVAGSFMVVMGLNIVGIVGKPDWLESKGGRIQRVGQMLAGEKTIWKFFPLGALFGFLPCGFSYTAFTAAAGTGGLMQGMFLMFCFGVGTVPSLLLFGTAASLISSKTRGIIYRLAGITVIIMGVLFIYRGLGRYA